MLKNKHKCAKIEKGGMKMNKKQKKNLITIVATCIGIILMVALYQYAMKNQDEFYAMKEQADNIAQPIVESAEEQGLKDVVVELRDVYYDGYHWYAADITCSNFGDFSPEEMYNVYKSIEFKDIGKRTIFGGDIYSGEDVYKIYVDSNTVYKNNEVIYDNYMNSKNHKDVQDRKNSSSDSEMKETTSSDKDSYGHTKYDAITIAEKEVKAQLKSPSTAKFSAASETSVTRSGNTWRVTGWVDAQNGLGATLRNSYTVKIEFASSDMYTVRECTVS